MYKKIRSLMLKTLVAPLWVTLWQMVRLALTAAFMAFWYGFFGALSYALVLLFPGQFWTIIVSWFLVLVGGPVCAVRSMEAFDIWDGPPPRLPQWLRGD